MVIQLVTWKPIENIFLIKNWTGKTSPGSHYKSSSDLFLNTHLFTIVLDWNLSLQTDTLSITDSSPGPKDKKMKPILCNTVTFIARTLFPVPLVSVLKRFDCGSISKIDQISSSLSQCCSLRYWFCIFISPPTL